VSIIVITLLTTIPFFITEVVMPIEEIPEPEPEVLVCPEYQIKVDGQCKCPPFSRLLDGLKNK
jgi:hypothetical protein